MNTPAQQPRAIRSLAAAWHRRHARLISFFIFICLLTLLIINAADSVRARSIIPSSPIPSAPNPVINAVPNAASNTGGMSFIGALPWEELLSLATPAATEATAVGPATTETDKGTVVYGALVHGPPNSTPGTDEAQPAPEPRSVAWLPRCGAQAAADPTSPASIVIGGLVPLSAPGAAAQGAEMQAALEVAQAHINRLGRLPVPIEIRVRDTRGTAAHAQAVARELIEQECAIGLVGIYHDDVALAVAEVAHEYGVPLIVARASSDVLLSPERPEVFRVGPSVGMVRAGYRAWLASAVEARRSENGEGSTQSPQALIVSTRHSAFNGRTTLLTSWFGEMDVKVHMFEVDAGQENFESLVARVITLPQRPQLVLLNVDGRTLLPLHAALVSAGLTPPHSTTVSVSVDPLEQSIWEGGNRVHDIVTFHVGPWQSTANSSATYFAEDYFAQLAQSQGDAQAEQTSNAQSNGWPPAHAFESYDALYLMAAAVEQAQSVAGEALIDALEATDLELASGRYFFPTEQTEDAEASLQRYHQWPDFPLHFIQLSGGGNEEMTASVVWPVSPASQVAGTGPLEE